MTAARRLAAALMLVPLAGCPKPPPPKAETPPAPVVVAVAARKTVPVEVRAIGTVKVLSTVSVRPRVNGELTAVHFKEGDEVRTGQKLFTIDPRPYEAAVRLAEANRAKNQAALAGAELNLARFERSGNGVASPAEIDAARTAVATGRAAVAADEASLHSAKLQLAFTTIASPIDGRTGAVLVTPGNLVSSADTGPLVVINQLSPIAVAFAVPEQDLPAVVSAGGGKPLPVEVHMRDGDEPIRGTLAFTDNAVDPATGTVTLKAEFPNADRRLWPGRFADVVLTLGDRPDSVVVPAAALQAGQQGRSVYVVADGKAVYRPVLVAFERAGEAVIAEGVAAGEQVVIDGQLRLAPGLKVEVKNPPATSASEVRDQRSEIKDKKPADPKRR
jgi:multidrug efflux system membrane fusion protein